MRAVVYFFPVCCAIIIIIAALYNRQVQRVTAIDLARVTTLPLSLSTTGDDFFSSSAMDGVSQIFYGTDGGKIVQVSAIDNTQQPPSTSSLSTGETLLSTAVSINTTHAMFFTKQNPSKSLMIQLSPTLAKISTTALVSGEDNSAVGAAIDSTNTIAYVAFLTSPTRLASISTLTNSRIAGFAFSSGNDGCSTIFIDTTSNTLYLALLTGTAQKVTTSSDGATMSAVASFSFTTGETGIYCGFASAGSGYFGSSDASSVIKFTLATMTRVTQLSLTPAASTKVRTVVLDFYKQFAVFGTETGHIVAVKIAPYTDPSIVSPVVFEQTSSPSLLAPSASGETKMYTSVVAAQNSSAEWVAAFGSFTSPSYSTLINIRRTRTSTMSQTKTASLKSRSRSLTRVPQVASDADDELSIGVIVGIAVGGTVFLVALITSPWWWPWCCVVCCGRGEEEDEENNEPTNEQKEDPNSHLDKYRVDDAAMNHKKNISGGDGDLSSLSESTLAAAVAAVVVEDGGSSSSSSRSSSARGRGGQQRQLQQAGDGYDDDNSISPSRRSNIGAEGPEVVGFIETISDHRRVPIYYEQGSLRPVFVAPSNLPVELHDRERGLHINRGDDSGSDDDDDDDREYSFSQQRQERRSRGELTEEMLRLRSALYENQDAIVQLEDTINELASLRNSSSSP